MRKVKWKQRILAVLLCASLVGQGMPLEGVAAEASSVAEIVEEMEVQTDGDENVSFESESENSVENAQAQTIENLGNDTEMENQMQSENVSENVEIAETESVETETATENIFESEIEETQVVLDSDGNIASGVIDEDFGHITWVIDADGKLIVEGTGGFSYPLSSKYNRAPWYVYKNAIKFAQINVKGIINTSYMFFGCNNMTNVDLSNFNTSNVINMESMFESCSSLSLLNVSNFDTSKVTDMSRMLCDCSSLSSLDLKSFDTYNVTNMSSMFANCSSLSSLNLNNFNTANVTDMRTMFYNCNSLSFLSLNNFNTANVTDMSALFSECGLLSSLNLDNFDTSNVTDMDSMFAGCSSLCSLNLNNFDTSKVTDMGGMFRNCSSLSSLNLNGFDTSKVTYIENIFCDCSSLISLDLSNFDTSKVSSMGSLFDGCDSLVSLNLSSFDTSEVTYMGNMFRNCSSLINLDLSNFNTSNVTAMESMFSGCSSLSSLNLDNFDTSNVTDMWEMFSGCSSLSSLNLDNFDTSEVTYMSNMFIGCSSLITLNLSGFDTSKVTDMGGMFFNCSSLSCLDLSSFNLSNIDASHDYIKALLGECSKLSTIYTPYNLKLSITLPISADVDKWYCSDGTIVTELPQNLSHSVALGKNQIPKEKEPSDIPVINKCGDNLTWTLKDNKDSLTLTISGTGDMYDYALENNTSTAPWIKQIKLKPVTLNIEEGATSIGKYAFYNCENINGNLIIPKSLTTIGDDAFYNCTKITDIYIPETLTQIGRNPFRYFNALIGTFKNMELTFHCPKNSYAYNWAVKNGFKVEEWDGITIDIKKGDITINGRGYAYARFLLKDNNGQVQKNTTISYSFGGRSYTATSGSDGYIQIRSELITDNKSTKKQIKTTEIILDPNGKKEKLNNRIVMDIKVTPFTYTQTWKVGMSGSVDIGFSGGISAEAGTAEAEATFGKAYATGKGKGTIALAIEHSGDTQNIKLEQNFNSRVGLKAKGGAETKAIALGKGIDINALTVSGNASVGAGQGIGLEIDNYNPGSFNDNLDIGKFAIAMIGSQTGNGMLIRLVDLMGVDLYNTSDKSTGFYAGVGANVGSIKYDDKDVGKIAGVEGSINYTYTTGKNENNKTRNHKMELEQSIEGNAIGVEFPVTGKVSIIDNIFSKEYMNSYAVELIEDYNSVARKLKIDLKTSDETSKDLYDKRNTKSLSFEFDAIDTQKLENDIPSIKQLKLGNLPCVTMAAAKDSLLTQIDKEEVSGTYNRSLSTSIGDKKDFSLGGSLGAKLKLGMGIEGLYDLKYNTESGTYQNGSIIKTSEVSDISDLVAGTDWDDFTDFFTDPVEIALNNAKNFIVDIGETFVDGVVDTYVTLKTTVEDGIGAIEKWVLHVVKIDGGNQKQRTFNSYGIMAVNAALNGEIETEKVVFTVSEPYYVYVTDEKGQTIDNFEKYPVELTLKYTDEMLAAAGVSAKDADNISIYQYSEELCGYICIGGTIDKKAKEVKIEITNSGQYLLAVDTSAPIVTDVRVSEETNKPLITVYFDEMSGFKEISVKLDEEEIVNASNWKTYYSAANSCVSYQVENELSDGTHNVSIYAVDSAGNAMPEPFVFEFHIGNNPDTDYGDILPEDIPADGIIPTGLWISETAPQNYTGKAIKPAVRVYDNKTLLIEKKDYTISYKNNIKANNAKSAKTAPTITVTGKGNYTGKETAVFEILPKDISDEDIEIDDITLSYNKKVQKPTPIITWKGKKLKAKTDFLVQYTDCAAQAYQSVGTYKISVSGTGNFSGKKELEVTITNNKLIAKMKTDKIANQPYTGKEIKPEVTIKNGKTLLKKDKDYTLEYNNNTEIGQASVTIVGTGAYSGKKKMFFNITGGSISQAKVTGLNVKMPYTGSEITQNCKLTVVLNGSTKTLKKGTDYTISYTNNRKAGKATIIFKGINGFSGVLKQNFTIDPFDIGSQSNSNCKITMPKTAPYAKGGSTPKPILTFNGETLCEGIDYTLSYKNNKQITNKNNPQVIIKGKGNFKGTRNFDFQITTQDMSNLTLNAADKMYQNKKSAYGTKVEIVDIDGKKLSAGKDYDKNLTYIYAADTKLSGNVLRKKGTAVEKNDIIPAGTVIQVSTTGKGCYKGTISGTFRITKADISKASIKVADQIYTGNLIEPDKADVTIKLSGKKIGNDCYEIVKYDRNVRKGKASLTIKGVGDYGGVKTVPFTIKSKGFLWWWRK